MEKSRFGKGFVTSLIHLSRHFALPAEQAFIGASDHLDELVVPPCFQGTEIADLVTMLRKKVLWHTPGSGDKEEQKDIIRILDRISVAVDVHLGIADASPGEYP